MLRAGDVLENRYEIIQEIGSGGMGVVFLAYHHGLQKYVVVKKIKDGFTGNLNHRVEVDILKNLHHPYLPQVFDFFQIEDQVYTVMDYVEGYDLEFYMRQGCRFEEKQLIFWLRQLLEVLSYLHGQTPPIIHSDIKPANIMVDAGGNICLIDFNISLGQDETRIIGLTRNYASPEQLGQYEESRGLSGGKNYQVDGRSDLYSLGLSFYVLMTGIDPSWGRDNLPSLLSVPCGYSKALRAVVAKAMEPEKKRRYRSAAQMLRALDQMERHPSRGLRILDRLMTAAWLLGVGAAVWLYVYGVGEERKGDYLEACGALRQCYAAYDGERVKSLGEEILQEKEWGVYLTADADQYADVLHAVGDAWFWEEDYGQAARYYRQALEAGPEGDVAKLCYRDGAIATARAGDVEEAKSILSEAVAAGISDGELLLVRGEIALQQGEFSEAEKSLRRILELFPDTELAVRAWQGIAKACGQQEDYGGQVQALSQVVEARRNIVNLRKLGAAYSQYASAVEDQGEKDGLNQSAKACYEEILGLDLCTEEDLRNYGVICENCGDYEESLRVFKQLAEGNPDDYELSKRICFLLYRMGDYRQMKDYYRLAWRQYEARQVDGETDDEMTALKEIVDALEKDGQ